MAVSAHERRLRGAVSSFLDYLRGVVGRNRRLLGEARYYFERKRAALLRLLYRWLRRERLAGYVRLLRATARMAPEERERVRARLLREIAILACLPETRRYAEEILAETEAMLSLIRRIETLRKLKVPEELEWLPGPLFRQAKVAKDDVVGVKEAEKEFLSEVADRLEELGRPEWAEVVRERYVRRLEGIIERIEERFARLPGYRVVEFAKYYEYVQPGNERFFELRVRVALPLDKAITPMLKRFVEAVMDMVMLYELGIYAVEEAIGFLEFVSEHGGDWTRVVTWEDRLFWVWSYIRETEGMFDPFVPVRNWRKGWFEGMDHEPCWKAGYEDGLAVVPGYRSEWPWACLDWRDLARMGEVPSCGERREAVSFDEDTWFYRERAHPFVWVGYVEVPEEYVPDCPVWAGRLLARRERIGLDVDDPDPKALRRAVMRAALFGPPEWERTEHGWHVRILRPWPWPEFNLGVRFLAGVDDPLRLTNDIVKWRLGLLEWVDTLFHEKWEKGAGA